MANTQELMLRIRGDNTDAERKIAQTDKSVAGFDITTRKASSAMRTFGKDLLQVRDASDLVSAATRALGSVIAGSLAGTAVVVAGKAVIDAYRGVQQAASESEKSISAARKSVEMIGASEGFQTTSAAAKMLFSEASKVSEKIKEIESNPLKNFIAGITGAREKMAGLVVETEKQAKALEEQGIRNSLVQNQIVASLSDQDKAIRAIAESYQPLIDAAVKSGNQELIKASILQQQGAVQKKIAEDKKKIDDENRKAFEDSVAYQKKLQTEQELYTIQRERALARERAELERQVKINEERLRQEKTMAEVSQARMRFERSGAVYSGKGGATKFNTEAANAAAISAGRGVLEATAAGRQALQVARKQREREVTMENLRAGRALNPSQRRSMAAQVAAAENPTLAQRSGGQDKLAASLERLINLMETAPLVTSGAGSN